MTLLSVDANYSKWAPLNDEISLSHYTSNTINLNISDKSFNGKAVLATDLTHVIFVIMAVKHHRSLA